MSVVLAKLVVGQLPHIKSCPSLRLPIATRIFHQISFCFSMIQALGIRAPFPYKYLFSRCIGYHDKDNAFRYGFCTILKI